MKLVWEIQIYPVIKFPKYVACQLRDIKKLEDSLEMSEGSLLLHSLWISGRQNSSESYQGGGDIAWIL